MSKVRITWSGMGGELDSVTVKDNGRNERVLTDALVNLIEGQIVSAGDTFTVEEVE